MSEQKPLETGLELNEPEVKRQELPPDVHRRFFGNCPSVEDLDCVSNWIVAQRLCGPDKGKFMSGVWHENLASIERRLERHYARLGHTNAPQAHSGAAVKVFRGTSTGGTRGKRIGKFGDNADDQYDEEPQTYGELVRRTCGEDSEEWSNYLRLKGLFGVPKPVEDEEHGSEEAVDDGASRAEDDDVLHPSGGPGDEDTQDRRDGEPGVSLPDPTS